MSIKSHVTMEDFEQDRDTHLHLDANGKWLIHCKENDACAFFWFCDNQVESLCI